MSSCRIADDFPAIRARLEELRREEGRGRDGDGAAERAPMGPRPFHASEFAARMRQREEGAAARRLRVPGISLIQINVGGRRRSGFVEDVVTDEAARHAELGIGFEKPVVLDVDLRDERLESVAVRKEMQMRGRAPRYGWTWCCSQPGNSTSRPVRGVTVNVASLVGDADFGSLKTLLSTPAFVRARVGSTYTGPSRIFTLSGGAPLTCASAGRDAKS